MPMGLWCGAGHYKDLSNEQDHYILYKNRMSIPFYNDYAKRFRFIFVPLHANDKEIKETRKILYGMRLYMHITSQSFVQSYRRFERNSYVHTSSTSDTTGIRFPYHYSHSYFYRAS